MKRLAIFLLGFVCYYGFSQSIISAEYFFDSDPGVGNGTVLPVNTNTGELTQTYSIPTTGLEEGFHSLYLRTINHEGNWSLYDRQIIYIKSFFGMGSDVVSAEYFIDSDPGIGNGTSVNITIPSQTITFNTDGLANGDHLFYVRVLNQDGEWSFYDFDIFTIDSSLGMDESLFKSVSIYPNPFVNEVSIGSSKVLNIQSIKVFDVNGKIVFSSLQNIKTINLDQLSNGIYILKLLANDKEATFKLVKQQ